jgi:hypothetical protein
MTRVCGLRSSDDRAITSEASSAPRLVTTSADHRRLAASRDGRLRSSIDAVDSKHLFESTRREQG